MVVPLIDQPGPETYDDTNPWFQFSVGGQKWGAAGSTFNSQDAIDLKEMMDTGLLTKRWGGIVNPSVLRMMNPFSMGFGAPRAGGQVPGPQRDANYYTKEGKAERRASWMGGLNSRMAANMSHRRPMMSGPGGSGRVGLLSEFNEVAAGPQSAAQMSYFLGHMIPSNVTNPKRKQKTEQELRDSYSRLQAAGILTGTGINELGLDKSDYMVRLMDKGPVSRDMHKLRNAYLRVKSSGERVPAKAVEDYAAPSPSDLPYITKETQDRIDKARIEDELSLGDKITTMSSQKELEEALGPRISPTPDAAELDARKKPKKPPAAAPKPPVAAPKKPAKRKQIGIDAILADIDKRSHMQDPDSNWLKEGTWSDFYKDTMSEWREGATYLSRFGDKVPRDKLAMARHNTPGNSDEYHWGWYEKYRDQVKKYAGKWATDMPTEGLNFTERDLTYSWDPARVPMADPDYNQYPAIPTDKHQRKTSYMWDDSWGEKFTQAHFGKMMLNIDRLAMPGLAQWQKGTGVIDPKVGDVAAIMKAGEGQDPSKYRGFGDSDSAYANLKTLEIEHFRRRPKLWEEAEGLGRGLAHGGDEWAGIGGPIDFKWRDYPNTKPTDADKEFRPMSQRPFSVSAKPIVGGRPGFNSQDRNNDPMGTPRLTPAAQKARDEEVKKTDNETKARLI